MSKDGKCAICRVVKAGTSAGDSSHGDLFVCLSCRDWNGSGEDVRRSQIDRENWQIHEDYMLNGWK